MNSYTFKDITVGTFAEFTKTISNEDMELFYKLSGDNSPIHMDESYAQKRGHKARVCYGMLSASLFSTLAGVYLPGEHCLLHSVEAKFVKPVYVGDVLTVSGKVSEVNETYKEITIKAAIVNQDNVKVTRGLIKAGIEE